MLVPFGLPMASTVLSLSFFCIGKQGTKAVSNWSLKIILMEHRPRLHVYIFYYVVCHCVCRQPGNHGGKIWNERCEIKMHDFLLLRRLQAHASALLPSEEENLRIAIHAAHGKHVCIILHIGLVCSRADAGQIPWDRLID
jgi:hypothetical protein